MTSLCVYLPSVANWLLVYHVLCTLHSCRSATQTARAALGLALDPAGVFCRRLEML